MTRVADLARTFARNVRTRYARWADDLEHKDARAFFTALSSGVAIFFGLSLVSVIVVGVLRIASSH